MRRRVLIRHPRGMETDRSTRASGGWLVSIFGDISREGSWRTPSRLSPFAVFGDIDLDLRQAHLADDEVTITAIAPCGSVDVVVPNGVRVDMTGFTVFGSKKVKVHELPPTAAAPVVRLRAFSLLGSLRVRSA
jgi:Cell wall-active antibiotics response 4TMS YvqF